MGRADLADELDGPDVDAELQRRGGDKGAQLARAQATLDPLAAFPRERPVVRGHLVLAQSLAELVGDALRKLSRVDEDERRLVVRDVRGDPVEDLVELVAGDRRLELAVGKLQRELEAPPVAAVDDRRQRLARPHQQARRGLERADRRREPDPHRRRSVTACSRSSDRVRCEPRLSRASAWISSTMTVSTVSSVARERSAVRYR